MTALAAIDIGTNSTRLLVQDGTTVLDRQLRTTRLGQRTDATGQLAAEAIERTLGALRDYREVLDRHRAYQLGVRPGQIAVACGRSAASAAAMRSSASSHVARRNASSRRSRASAEQQVA